jgi:ATP adenylyltransferase/5',5'''-P-1,P-4-tetraphosphate phosphorylase II
MSVSSYSQQLLVAVSRLEDYGLVNTITSNSETRPSGELFINIKVELIDNSVLFIREYVSSRQEHIEHFSYAYQYQAADESLIFRYDNAPHKPALAEKEHKHLQNVEIILCPLPSIESIIEEILSWLTVDN